MSGIIREPLRKKPRLEVDSSQVEVYTSPVPSPSSDYSEWDFLDNERNSFCDEDSVSDFEVEAFFREFSEESYSKSSLHGPLSGKITTPKTTIQLPNPHPITVSKLPPPASSAQNSSKQLSVSQQLKNLKFPQQTQPQIPHTTVPTHYAPITIPYTSLMVPNPSPMMMPQMMVPWTVVHPAFAGVHQVAPTTKPNTTQINNNSRGVKRPRSEISNTKQNTVVLRKEVKQAVKEKAKAPFLKRGRTNAVPMVVGS